MDIFSRKIVGWEVHERETADLAAALIQRAVLAEGCTLRPLVLRVLQPSARQQRQSLLRGAVPNLQIPPRLAEQGFCHQGCSQAWVQSFTGWYNDEHLPHSGIRFVTPDARHAGRDRATLANRTILYANARAQHPERWSGKTRNWQPAGPVWLNPENEISAPEIRDAA